MNHWDQKLIREQLDEKLTQLAVSSAALSLKGRWVKLLRQALSMTTAQLAHRAGLDQSRIPRIEKQESSGDIKISTLERIAEALDMKFVYGFVPNGTLESLVAKQAKKLAIERLSRLTHTMSLEEQQLSSEQMKKALSDMIQRIMIENPKDLWDK